MSPGRLPAEVYWRRRLLALAALIALVWVVLRLVGGDDEGEPKAAPTTEPTATATTAKPAVAPTNGIVDVTLVSASRPCDPQKIRMTPTVEPGQRVKTPVEIGLVVSSTEKTACTLTPEKADLVAVISANKTAIWDSTVCKVSLLEDSVAISPQWATLVTGTWSGRGSGSTCSAKEGYASPGTYTVQVGTLGGEPGKASFRLERTPSARTTKPTPTKTPTKKAAKPPKKTPSHKNTTKPAD